jgi:hypothetical protein
VDPADIATVLDGIAFPARTWQLLAQADYYGAGGGRIRADLGRLPNRVYPSLAAVIATLGSLSAACPAPQQPSPDVPG